MSLLLLFSECPCGLQAVMPTLGWRWLLSLSSVPLAVLLLFYSFVPESPRYLASKGDTAKAVRILQQMADTNGRPLPTGRLVGSQQHVDLEIKRGTSERNVEMGKGLHSSAEEENSLLALPESKVDTHSQRKNNNVVLNGVFSNFSALLSPPLISSTLLLWSVFFANAFTYYGLVLLTSQLSGGEADCVLDSTAVSAAHSPGSDHLYRDVFVSSIGGRIRSKSTT